MGVGALKALAAMGHGVTAVQLSAVVEKGELVAMAKAAAQQQRQGPATKYNLISNMCHDTDPDAAKDQGTADKMRKKATAVGSSGGDPIAAGTYRVHVVNPVSVCVLGWG